MAMRYVIRDGSRALAHTDVLVTPWLGACESSHPRPTASEQSAGRRCPVCPSRAQPSNAVLRVPHWAVRATPGDPPTANVRLRVCHPGPPRTTAIIDNTDAPPRRDSRSRPPHTL